MRTGWDAGDNLEMGAERLTGRELDWADVGVGGV